MHPGLGIPEATRFFSSRSFLRGIVAGIVVLGGLLTPVALAHSGPPRATCVAIAADGRALTSDDLGRLLAWDISNPDQPTLAAKFSQKHTKKAAYVATVGNRVLTAGFDGQVLIHDLDAPEKVNKPFTGHQSTDGKREVWVAILSPDGTQALSGANDGQILLWDPSDVQKPHRRFFYQDKQKKDKNAEGPVAGLAFLPPRGGKQRFLSTHGYGDVHLWEFDPNDDKDSAIVHTFSRDNSRQINALAVLDDGSTFVAAGFDSTLRQWDIERRKMIEEFKGHKDWIWRVAVSPNSELVATASEDGTVRVWNVKAAKEPILVLKEDPNHASMSGGSMGVAFTNDGRLVYTLDGAEAAKDPGHINGLIKVEPIKVEKEK